MTYSIFLDDERFPVNENSHIVRSYDEFVELIQRMGPPDDVSFDHDLGFDAGDGMECVNFLINQDFFEWKLAWNGKYSVHSMNPVGRDNIKSAIDSYLKNRQKLFDA